MRTFFELAQKVTVTGSEPSQFVPSLNIQVMGP